MNSRKYTAQFFRDSFPEWKKKKDSILVRHFFRPLSFYTASIAANMGLSANSISFFSIVIAVIGSVLYLGGYRATNILGAVLVWFWMLLDCTDGNIARSIKKQPFGEFADASSSYILINFLFAALGVSAYRTGGIFISAGSWRIAFLGAFIGGADSLARLLYQKFENTKKVESVKDTVIPKSKDSSNTNHLIVLHDRIDKEFGLNGIFLPLLLICSVFTWIDLYVLIYSLFYLSSLIATAALLIYKTMKAQS